MCFGDLFKNQKQSNQRSQCEMKIQAFDANNLIILKIWLWSRREHFWTFRSERLVFQRTWKKLGSYYFHLICVTSKYHMHVKVAFVICCPQNCSRSLFIYGCKQFSWDIFIIIQNSTWTKAKHFWCMTGHKPWRLVSNLSMWGQEKCASVQYCTLKLLYNCQNIYLSIQMLVSVNGRPSYVTLFRELV